MRSNNHPNRRSVNAAFFEAFLRRLLDDANPILSQETLLEILRETALQEAFDRLNDRRGLSKVFQITMFQDKGLSFYAENDFIGVRDHRGNAVGLSRADQVIAQEELRRLTRGMPHWLPLLWSFLS